VNRRGRLKTKAPENKFSSFSHLPFRLVGDEVSGWNPFLNSLLDLVEELEELGVMYAKKQAFYVESNWT
jgi:hypothetical protein